MPSTANREDRKDQSEVDQLKLVTNAKNILQIPNLKTSKKILVLKSILKKNSLPTTVKRFISDKAKNIFTNWALDKTWSHVIFDGLHPAALFFKDNKFDIPFAKYICLRAHNVETELWSQVAIRTKIPLKWIYDLEQKRMEKFEINFLNCCQLIATVSEIDRKKLIHLAPKANIISTPIGMNWALSPKKKFPETFKVLFIGRLDWYPNTEGLIWFLKEIWPQVITARKDITLDIIGGFIPENLLDQIQKAQQIKFHGSVENIQPFYEDASLSIIPIWTGSGTRVKAIESAQFARSFLSTSKGIEGVVLTSNLEYFLSDNKDEWIKILKELNNHQCETMGQAVFDKLQKTYDQTKIQKDLIEKLKDLNAQ